MTYLSTCFSAPLLLACQTIPRMCHTRFLQPFLTSLHMNRHWNVNHHDNLSFVIEVDVMCRVMLELGVSLPAPAQPLFKKNCKVR